MNPSSLRAACVQFQHRANDVAYNLSVINRFAGLAQVRQVQLLVFPEMCISGYWHLRKLDVASLEALAETVDGPSITYVTQLAQRTGIAIGVGWLERGNDGALFNSYAICLPDGQRHVHRKLHAFEHPHIQSGGRYTVFDTPWGVRAAILICWDNNLVENVRVCALAGATLLIAPHQTGGTESRSPHGMKRVPLETWDRRMIEPQAIEEAFKGDSGRGWLLRWLPARAHDNGMFVLFSNGVGPDDDEVRTGNAMLIDPYGRILAETWAAEDAIVVADLNLQLIDKCTGQRWLRGRRPELYASLAQLRGDEVDPRQARFSEESTHPLSQPEFDLSSFVLAAAFVAAPAAAQERVGVLMLHGKNQVATWI